MLQTKYLASLGSLLLLSLLIPQVHASLDLLAGVEAGIETDTAMTNTDLERTQNILSKKAAEFIDTWTNDQTGITYQIYIKRSYTYGNYPCLAYDLTILKNDSHEIKSLDACQHRSGKWISVSPSSMAL